MLAKYDLVLHGHLQKVSQSKKIALPYLSPNIQNEFIVLLGDHVRNKIINQVKRSQYYAIMFDSTTDSSHHKEQTSQVLRYVVKEGQTVKIEESFIAFIETIEKPANAYTSTILQKLQEDGIDIQDSRGQTYDNASVMIGRANGVQQRIKEVNPKAVFVACSNHSLNRAGVHAASTTTPSLTFFGILEKLYSFFARSSHRWDLLTSKTGTLKKLSDTR